MSLMDMSSASAALLRYLDTLSGNVGDEHHPTSPKSEKSPSTLEEYRVDIDNINKELGRCSWIIATLLHSLEEVNKTQERLMERHKRLLDEENQLASARPKPVHGHLPYEILCLIAQYAHPNPISVEEALKLKGGWEKWDEVVLKTSSIKIDGMPFHWQSPLLPEFLSTPDSFPGNWIINLSWFVPRATILLPLCNRWHSLSIAQDLPGDSLKEALLGLPCPNCPPPLSHTDDVVPVGCTDHTVLSSLVSFSTSHQLASWFCTRGLMRNIKRLTLTVTVCDDPDAAIDLSALVPETPALSELTIIWRWWMKAFPPLEVWHQACFPRLKRLNFVIEEAEEPAPLAARLQWMRYVLGSIDGARVEELCLHILHTRPRLNPGDEEAEVDARYREQQDVMKFLEKTFPGIVSLALRAEHGIRDSHFKTLESQDGFLDALIRTDEEAQIFPHLTNLSLELDQTREGLDALLRVLDARAWGASRAHLLKKVRNLDLFDSGFGSQEDSRMEREDFLSKIRVFVRHVTICVPLADFE